MAVLLGGGGKLHFPASQPTIVVLGPVGGWVCRNDTLAYLNKSRPQPKTVIVSWRTFKTNYYQARG